MAQSQRGKRSRPEEIDLWMMARPFPSTFVLASMPSKPYEIPLLTGILPEKRETSPAVSHEEILAEIDNPRNSTLTRDQHDRYLKLDAQKSFTRKNRQLRSLVRLEQEAYRKARDQFVVDNSRRFLIGFATPPASEYATWHSEYTRAYIEQWKKLNCPMEYGKVRQVIGLSKQEGEIWMPNEAFDSQVLVPMSVAPSPTTLPRTRNALVMSPMLRDDPTALALAQEHGASAIVSSQVLEHVLLLEEWKVPVWNQGVKILDEPLPQATLPRSCLTRGMEEALNESQSQFIYTLLTVKPKDRKILVRGRVTTYRVHLEYFPERGIEQLSSQEMALWILDSLLVKSHVQELVRINVQNWTIMHQEPVSVAHALASGNDVMNCWNRLPLLLNSLERMPFDEQQLLVCLGHTVSVHRADDHDVAIAMKDEFENADAVRTSAVSLVECFRPWKWETEGRIEDTFPIQEEETSITHRKIKGDGI